MIKFVGIRDDVCEPESPEWISGDRVVFETFGMIVLIIA